MSDPVPERWHTAGVGFTQGIDATARVGRFQLSRVIGKGGMGIVYEAIQEQPRRRVAVKLLNDAVLTAEQLKRFERESDLLARLKHPNIAEVYEAGTHRDGPMNLPYYAMELIEEAVPITDYAQSKGLSRIERIRLFIVACRAVAHAHQHEVLHRDLKPGNLLVDKHGTLKLIDLGISRLMSDASVILTGKDQMLGTLRYMAPEQLMGEVDLPSMKWDVYALGAVLFELLVGQPPVKSEDSNPVRLANAIIRNAPTRPRAVDPSIERDLELVMLTAVHRDAMQRYGTVAEFADDLQRVLDHRPIRARGDRLGYVLSKRLASGIARHPILASLLVLAAITIGLEQLSTTFARTGFDGWWLKQLTTRLNYVPDRPLQHVQMIEIKSGLEIAAETLGIDQYDPADVVSGRLMHAALLRKLADAGARVVAFDITFVRPTRFDQALADAASEARAGGTEVVFALPAWTTSREPQLTPALRGPFRYGAALAHATRDLTWSLPAARMPEGELSFYGQVIAAVHSVPPDAEITFNARSELLTARSDGERLALLSYSVVSNDESAPVATDDRLAQLCAQTYLDVPSDPMLSQSTRDMADILLMPVSELETLVRGRVVIVGDGRPNRDGPFTHPDGRQLPGYVVHSVAIDSTLDSRTIGFPPTGLLGPFVIGPVVLCELLIGAGALLMALRVRTIGGWIGLTTGVAAFVVGAVVIAFTVSGWILPVIEPVCAAMLCSGAVVLGRRVIS